jgi:hypothetical protein
MQLRGWNTAIAAAVAGIAGTIVFDLAGALEDHARAAVGAA